MFLLVPAYLGCPGQKPLNGCVCVCVRACVRVLLHATLLFHSVFVVAARCMHCVCLNLMGMFIVCEKNLTWYRMPSSQIQMTKVHGSTIDGY